MLADDQSIIEIPDTWHLVADHPEDYSWLGIGQPPTPVIPIATHGADGVERLWLALPAQSWGRLWSQRPLSREHVVKAYKQSVIGNAPAKGPNPLQALQRAK